MKIETTGKQRYEFSTPSSPTVDDLVPRHMETVLSHLATHPTPPIKNLYLSLDRVEKNVLMHLRHILKKFKGDLEECWMEFVYENEQISFEENLTPPKKLQMHNIFKKDAQRFYIYRLIVYAN